MAGVTTPPTEVGMEQIHPAFLSFYGPESPYGDGIRGWWNAMHSEKGAIRPVSRLLGEAVRTEVVAHSITLPPRLDVVCAGSLVLEDRDNLRFQARLSTFKNERQKQEVGQVSVFAIAAELGCSSLSTKDRAIIAGKEIGSGIVELSREPATDVSELLRMSRDTAELRTSLGLRLEVAAIFSAISEVHVAKVGA